MRSGGNSSGVETGSGCMHEQVEESQVTQDTEDCARNLAPVSGTQIPAFTEEVRKYAISRPTTLADAAQHLSGMSQNRGFLHT